MSDWTCALELNEKREPTGGSARTLSDAIRRGADLRIGTDFLYNEHIRPGSDNPETVRELSDFRTTYLVEDHWVAGIMTLRYQFPARRYGPWWGPNGM